MTQRTRYFLAGSAMVVIVGLCTGLVAYYSGNLPLRSSAIGPAELAYVPADAQAVAFANVHDIMASEFRQRLRQVLPTGEEKDKLKAETGIDIEQDIDTVVAGFSGSKMDQSSAVVMVRGRFNDGQITALLTQHGAQAEDYGGKRMLVAPQREMAAGQEATPEAPAKTGFTGALAFLEPGLLALGDTAAVKRAIDAGATREDVTKNADLMQFVADVDRNSNAWVVGTLAAVSQSGKLPPQVQDSVSAVKMFALSAHVNNGVKGTLQAVARDDQSAENLRDVVRGGLAAARMMTSQDTKMTDMLNSLQLTGSGTTVTLSFTVPADLLDMLNGIGALNNLQGGGGGS
jgi:hypothetical protein